MGTTSPAAAPIRECASDSELGGSNGVGQLAYVEKGQLFPYIRNRAVFLCPTDLKRTAKQITGQPKDYAISYSMNFKFINPTTKQTIVLDTIRRQKQVLLLIHESRETINDGDFNWESTLDIRAMCTTTARPWYMWTPTRCTEATRAQVGVREATPPRQSAIACIPLLDPAR